MDELMLKASELKKASKKLTILLTNEKNEALKVIANELLHQSDFIIAENKKDMDIGKEQGFSPSLLDRLLLTRERIEAMADGIRQVLSLEDPIGETIDAWELPNGLKLANIRVPFGVIGMVYEARPNVTIDATVLCLKTGNAVLLRGSTSALHSNKALVQVMKAALRKTSIPEEAVQLLEDTSRDTAARMFCLNEYLDVLIPRGGAGLIRTVMENATVPVLETGVGNCHIFIDETANVDMAIDIVLNAKVQRPSVCNAVETVLIHEKWTYTKNLLEALQEKNVEIHGDKAIMDYSPNIKAATEDDWKYEFLAPVLAVKTVPDVEAAINHIDQYGTKHSEAIISENDHNVNRFFQSIDAAVIYHNASTRFTDGEQFGYGAEIGISTQKLHARGPMGLKAITTTKTIARGNGQIRV